MAAIDPANGVSGPASEGKRPPMQFGVLQFFSWPNRAVPLQTVYARALDRIDMMEHSGGYEAVWLAEHHFNTYSVCPSVHLMGMLVAARTAKLRIGTAVSLAPMYHPLRLAEEVALLDVLSGGRVNWGAGRGNDPTEFGVFGLDLDSSYAHFRENVEIVVRAWSEERISYSGQFTTVENIEVLPKPLQKPHPPVWLAASSPDALNWAGSQGYSILMDPHSPHGDIAAKFNNYKAALSTGGHTFAGRRIPMARLIAVAPTDDEARETARRGAQWTVSAYVNPNRRAQNRANHLRPAGAPPVDANVDPIDRYVNQVIIHGSPARMVDEILRLREEIGLDYLLCAPLSHQSFVLFTEEVLPALARQVAIGAAASAAD
ncbi:MAG TPA: LLM class flavin-dependent oxidoreductase [Dehalococcoidia bacterium]|nr:LLM class flavin-dependent oxidoreductase [Dehalococcoidia bacterium]